MRATFYMKSGNKISVWLKELEFRTNGHGGIDFLRVQGYTIFGYRIPFMGYLQVKSMNLEQIEAIVRT